MDPNADSKVTAIFFRQLNFSSKDFLHAKMFFTCFQSFPAISANQQILMFTMKMLQNQSAPSGSLQYSSIQMHVSSSLPCCLIIAGAPSIVTENIFISILLSSKFFESVKYIISFSSSMHRIQATKFFMNLVFTAVLSYKIAKSVLLFISMLLSGAMLKTFAAFNATVCCSVTLVNTLVMCLSTVQGETGYP